ncbi:phosphotransferase [soil metagenome]
MLEELAGRFERVTPAAASTLLREHYGVEAVGLERLDTERDDSFRVTTTEGYLVLKVAHPGDDPAVIALQSSAMERAGERGLPVQRVVRTVTAESSVVVGGRTARVLSWLDGEPLADTAPDEEQLFALGAALGGLNAALADFEHPASHRELAWDIQRTAALRGHATEPELAGVIDRFERVVAPALARLPQQVIHNDFHPGNLLVADGEEPFVVGILDFGDVVHTARVCDLGVAIAYLVPEDGPAWRNADEVIRGFESVVPLLDEERDLLPDLVAARLLMRSVIPLVVPQPRTDTLHYVDRNRRLLHRILEGT